MIQEFEATSNLQSQQKLNVDSVFNLFLDAARNQYFENGNKRTGQLVMNGILITSGFAPFTVSPSKDTEFREKLLNFRETGNKRDMVDFIFSSINSPRYLVMQEHRD